MLTGTGGMERRDLERQIGAVVAEYVDPAGPGLSLLIGRSNQVILAKGYGMADVTRGEPLTAASRFVIGSVTKQFTAMAVMMLRHRGALAYDDCLARWLPGLPGWSDRVTLRHLLQHTGGVREYLTEEFWTAAGEGKYPDLDSVLRRIATFEDLEFDPGTRWRYCNSGYVLLGAVVERASGRSFASFLKEHVFDRLGMADTFVGETDERVPRLATGYEYKTRGDFRPAPWHFAVIGWADGNMISTPADLFRWGQALYTDELLPLSELAAAFVPCRPLDATFSRYGFGHLVGDRRGVREIHHGGGTLGYVSAFTRFTDEQLTLVILSNAAGIKLAEIAGRVAGMCLGDKLAPLAPAVLPEASRQEVAGLYEGSPRDHRIRVTVRAVPDGDLAAELTHGEQESPPQLYEGLLALGGDLFCADPVTDTYLEFTRDHAGGIAGLRIKRSGSVENLSRVCSPPEVDEPAQARAGQAE